MNNKDNLTEERPPLIPTIIGTGFGSGFFPWGPGTAGSVLATAIWWVLARYVINSAGMLTVVTTALIVAFTILGTWATARLQPYWGEDPSRVVVDEMVGVWIPLSLLRPTDHIAWAILALALFRFYDIVKPLGIKALDRKSGAFWVMGDDILGGVYAAVTLLLIRSVQLLISVS